MIRRTSSRIAGGALLALFLVPISLMGEAMKNQDARAREQWVEDWVGGSQSKVVPFSFEYDGNPNAKLLEAWSRTATTRQLDATRKEYTVNWLDRRTGLEIRIGE
jgi:hypothetical protein